MGKMKPGAPTKYRDEYCQKILEYFSKNPYEEKEVMVATKDGPMMIKKEVASDCPSMAGFAISIGIPKRTILDWTKKHEEFAEAYELAKCYQENFLIVNGNRGLINTAFGIFSTKNIIGWRDKQPDETDNFNINVNLAEKMAKARARVTKKGE
jgi:hypothetical protein